ncbi:MAG: phage capsid protein [Caulobacteraceae bacterium]
MADSEDTVLSQYVPGFRANLNLAPQQTDTRLLSGVDGDLAYDTPGQMFNADDVQTSDPEIITSRVPQTPDKFPGFTRRVGIFVPFQDAAWIDNVDKARELVDPTNKVMMSLMAGRWRFVDTTILGTTAGVGGLLGKAPTKLDASGAITYQALPAAQIVASTDVSFAHDAEIVPIDGSQYGLSVGKLLHAMEILDESELEGPRHLALSSQQKTDLLRRTPVTSRYYADVEALVKGELDEFLDFNIHRLQKARIPSAGLGHDNASAIRQCVAWIEGACVYRGRPITDARIRIRPDRSDTPQAFYKTEHGSVRRYDTAVVEIDCYEGAQY